MNIYPVLLKKVQQDVIPLSIADIDIELLVGGRWVVRVVYAKPFLCQTHLSCVFDDSWKAYITYLLIPATSAFCDFQFFLHVSDWGWPLFMGGGIFYGACLIVSTCKKYNKG